MIAKLAVRRVSWIAPGRLRYAGGFHGAVREVGQLPGGELVVGGTFAAAMKVAKESPEGTVLLAMLPDTGERYLSTFLFEGITEESDVIAG